LSSGDRRTAGRTLAALLAGVSAAVPLGAAEVTSQSCARWEGNYRSLVLQAGITLLVIGFLIAWIAPWLMRATGRLWRWALGVTGRSLWPGFWLGFLALVLWLVFIFPGPWRTQLGAFQIQNEYFPAPTSTPARSAATTTAATTLRPADCTNVNFTKRGLIWGLGAGETLAAQPFLTLAFLLCAAAVGGLLARMSYAVVGRLHAPWARARRAAREGRGVVR
jgi:hypothetical protein